ncbi:Hint domain-containing protein [uncultured Shimia sp.]|uniref:Hint domain-containing protein n=1 Tax=uncultured Shimia sp. TaxID=573152 RepID=UPI00261AB4B1|nr:Hint domain-containing protein [uncultured Shimia sp.]
MAQAQQAETRIPAQDITDLELSCVARGTKVATRRGEVAVEELLAGDEVVSRDKGLTPIRWIGRLSAINASIKVPAGAMGRRVPARDCWLAPNARLWMQGAEFEDAFTCREVLVPVKDLAGWRGITEDLGRPSEFFLVLCDTPSVMIVDGMQVEMRHPGALMSLFEQVQADEMADLFPELLAMDAKSDKWRRRLDKHEAGQVLDVKKRA